ncbi:MAG: hypothetical protein ACF8NJ_08930 [Phycisphaerales bacterium JB038]
MQRKNGLSLVEWTVDGVPNRAWATPDMIETENGNTVTVLSPEEGIPYGVDFAEIVSTDVTPQMIDTELKRAGIWTYNDVVRQPERARQAIASAYGVNLAELLKAARRYERNQLED